MDDRARRQAAYAAERAAQRQALSAELYALGQQDDPASLERRYELHCALAGLVAAPGTDHAQTQAEQALALARRLADPLREARALYLLGRFARNVRPYPVQAHIDRRRGCLTAALAIREARLGPDHPDVAEVLLELASLEPAQAAIALLERAAAIYERALGAEHERTWNVLIRLVFKYQAGRAYTRALAVYERMLAVAPRGFGPEPDSRAQRLWFESGRLQSPPEDHAAELAVMRAHLTLLQRCLGPYHQTVYGQIAAIYLARRQQGEEAAADAELDQALAQLEADRGMDHPTTLECLVMVVDMLWRPYLSRARPIHERAVVAALATSARSDATFNAIYSAFALSGCFGDHAAAFALFPLLLPYATRLDKLLGGSFSLLHLGAGIDLSVIEQLYGQLLAATEQTHGPEHPAVAAVLVDWAAKRMSVAMDDAAIPLLTRALTIHPQALADNDGRLLQLIRSIDAARSATGADAVVRDLYRHAYEVCAPALGAAHPQVAELRFRLRLFPEAAPGSADNATTRDAAPVLKAAAEGLLDGADVVIYQAPADWAATEALRAILREAGLVAAAAGSLDTAIAAPAELLILFLPDAQPLTLSSEQIARLQQRAVIGVGRGAARIFDALGLALWAGAPIYSGAALPLVVEPNQLAPLPGLGDQAGTPHGGAGQNYGHFGLALPAASPLRASVDVIARSALEPRHVLMARQGRHILIGAVCPPYLWTPAYAELFVAVTRALRTAPPQALAQTTWETARPGVSLFTLAPGSSTSAAAQYLASLHVERPTTVSATLTVATSRDVLLLCTGALRAHWACAEGGAGATLTISVEILAEDLRAVEDPALRLLVVNRDAEHPATCTLRLDDTE